MMADPLTLEAIRQRLKAPASMGYAVHYQQDVRYLLHALEAAMRVVQTADKIAQSRIEPYASWDLHQDLRDALTAFRAHRGKES